MKDDVYVTTIGSKEPQLTKESLMKIIDGISVKTSNALPSEKREPRLSDWIKKHIPDKGLLGKIFYKSSPCVYMVDTSCMEMFMNPKNLIYFNRHANQRSE